MAGREELKRLPSSDHTHGNYRTLNLMAECPLLLGCNPFSRRSCAPPYLWCFVIQVLTHNSWLLLKCRPITGKKILAGFSYSLKWNSWMAEGRTILMKMHVECLQNREKTLGAAFIRSTLDWLTFLQYLYSYQFQTATWFVLVFFLRFVYFPK